MKPGLFTSWREAILSLAAAIGLAAILWIFAVGFVILFTPPPGTN